MQSEVARYSRPVRILHWTYAGVFLLLFLTGLIVFVPAFGPLASGGWTRLLHRVGAALFGLVPVTYLVIRPRDAWRAIKDAFVWGKEDIAWVKAMPRYYFLLDEKAMPPQDHLNTGQKLWWLMVILGEFMFILSGSLILVSKAMATKTLFEWSMVLHDITFVATGCMLMVHVYLSILHPLMRPLRDGPWSAMTRGWVSVEHARKHHAKWYERVMQQKEAEQQSETAPAAAAAFERDIASPAGIAGK